MRRENVSIKLILRDGKTVKGAGRTGIIIICQLNKRTVFIRKYAVLK